jgi:hypothetical protein
MRAISQSSSVIEPIKRAAALLLTITMLGTGVLKAQGCQSAPKSENTPQAQPIAPTHAADTPHTAPADTNADTQADAQADMEEEEEEPEFFPATKSGMPIRPNRKFMPATKAAPPMPKANDDAPQPQTQQQAPKK